MDAIPPLPIPERRFTIKYEKFTGTVYNSKLKGRGTLTVDLAAGTYAFAGKRRGIFAGSQRVETFRSRQISNVLRQGSRIQFAVADGKAASPAPFLFYCSSENEAVEIQQLLPTGTDDDFQGQLLYEEKLRMLPGSGPWYASITGMLVMLNVAMFLVMGFVFQAGWITTDRMEPYLRFAASNGAATTHGQWWRLLVSMFVHYGVFHLAMNMWALVDVGRLLERLEGKLLFTLIYFGSGVGAGLVSIAWHGDKVWSAGASGAIFGLLGATLGYILRQKNALPRSVFKPMLKSCVVFAGYNLLYGAANPQIDNAAHIGGFLCGLLLGWATALPMELEARAALLKPRLFAGLCISVATLILGVFLTPRFDYRVADELAWSEAFQEVAEQETKLNQRQLELIKGFKATGVNVEAIDQLVRTELEPFYRGLQKKLQLLELEKGLRTDRRRTLLLQVVELKLQGCEALVEAVTTRAAGAMENYDRLESEAIKALQVAASTPS